VKGGELFDWCWRVIRALMRNGVIGWEAFGEQRGEREGSARCSDESKRNREVGRNIVRDVSVAAACCCPRWYC
jgi:hypothetical protein